MKSDFLERLVSLFSKEISKEDATIISMNARVENYFSVMLYRILTQHKNHLGIDCVKFQHHLSNSETRRHIDFKIKLSSGEFVYLELKHFAKSSSGPRNYLNFYFGNNKTTSIQNDLKKFERDQLTGQKCMLVIVSAENLNELPMHQYEFPNWVGNQMTSSNSFSIFTYTSIS
jgi:DNA-binding sugar fermentation-stimulating protein